MAKRMFVAIELPAGLAGELAALDPRIPGLRWLPAGQLHLTLAFLGDVEEEQRPGLLGELADGIPAMEEDAFLAVDIGQRAFATRRRGIAGIVREHPRSAVELADVDHARARGAFQDGKVQILAADRQLSLLVRQIASPIVSVSTGCLRVDTRQAFLLAEEGQYIENSRRSGLPR